MRDAALDLTVPPGVPDTPDGAVVTVGTFDGIHRGHWAVLQETRRWARSDGRRSVLATFHPHPLTIVRPSAAPALLTTPEEKEEILAESGLDYAVFLPFTPVLMRYPPERFVEEVLIDRLRMRRLVIGYDHGFGRGRSGDVDTLRDIGERLGFDVHVVDAVHMGDAPISSTLIRTALQKGDVVAAAAGLGRPYSLRAPVVRGDGRGRSLGFATANLRPGGNDKLLPREGIYAVRTVLPGRRRPDGRPLDGVLHLGPRPTFQGAAPTIELHLFDFDDDLYGEELRVDFCGWIRGIHHFGSIPALIEAVRADCAAARSLLGSGTGACRSGEGPLD